MTKTSTQRRLWRNFIQCGLVVPIFIHSRSLLFEGRCFQQFSSHITTYLVATGSSMGLGGSHFYTYNSGFPCAFIYLSFMLMAVDFSRTQKSYSVHVFNLYYIKLFIWRQDNVLLADFRILTICIINLYILHGMFLVLI